MKFACEIVVRDVLPVVRAVIVRELTDKYKLTQPEIAARLGITQASVSYYLGKKRGHSDRLSKDMVNIRKVSEKAAEALASKSIPMIEVMKIICDEVCKTLRRRGAICEAHEAVFPSIRGKICKVCETSA